MADYFNNAPAIAVLGGLVPAILWLWFWLQEDKLHPEPRRILVASFVAGAAVTAIALPFEQYASTIADKGLILYLAWAVIEEIAKLAGAYFAALSEPSYDEPVDAMIYMITAALGFAALENGLFLIKAFEASGSAGALVTGNIRFVGATLVHIVSSAIVGGSLALAYYKSKWTKFIYLIVGLITASTLHALFNFFIIMDEGKHTFTVFFFLWIFVVAILLLFEKVKHLK